MRGAPALAVPTSSLHATAHVEPAAATTLLCDAYRGPLADAPASLAPTGAAIHAATAHLGLRGGWTVRIASDIPSSGGLGSSAATAAAITRAFADVAAVSLDAETLHGLVQEAERTAHGTPSGVDARTVVAEAPVWLEHGVATTAPSGARMTLVVGDTGAAASTRGVIDAVRAAIAADPHAIDGAIQELSALPEPARAALATGDHRTLGLLMRSAHTHLGALGVSTEPLDRLVDAADGAGALGAKLTGAGGGGCMVALVHDDAHATLVTEALRAAGAVDCWTTTVEAT